MIRTPLSSKPISGTLYVRCYSPSLSTGGVMRVHYLNSYGVWTELLGGTGTNLYTPSGESGAYFYNCGYIYDATDIAIVAFYPTPGGKASRVNVDCIFIL